MITQQQRDDIVQVVSAFAGEASVCWEQAALQSGDPWDPSSTTARINTAVNAIVAVVGGVERDPNLPPPGVVPDVPSP